MASIIHTVLRSNARHTSTSILMRTLREWLHRLLDTMQRERGDRTDLLVLDVKTVRQGML